MSIPQKITEPGLGIEMLSARQLREAFGVCQMTIYRMMERDDSFPRPMKLAGSTRNFFSKVEVEAWIRANREAAV